MVEHMWEPIANAPFGRDLELAVIDRDGTHSLVFPCRRSLSGWIKSASKEMIEVSPTHWRAWSDGGVEENAVNHEGGSASGP